MVNRNKARGTAAETSWVRFLQYVGFPGAERRALSGAHDRGDVAGIRGWVNEVKSGANLNIPAWLNEAAIEAGNAGVVRYAVVVKPVGVADPAKFWFIVPGWLGAELMLEDVDDAS